METIKRWIMAIINGVKNTVVKIYDWIQDSPTFVRWGVLILLFTFLFKSGIGAEEIKVALMLVWYSVIATGIASFMNYAYGKVNYHKAKDDPTYIYAQVAIFVGVYIFAGLFMVATYIAQFS